jgi:hypothetical protein
LPSQLVGLFGQAENDSFCSEMHEIGLVEALCNDKATPIIVYFSPREYNMLFCSFALKWCLVVMPDQ